MKSKVALLAFIVLFLTGCGAFAKASPTPLPTVMLGQEQETPQASTAVEGGVTASGVIAPEQEAKMAFTMGGRIKAVNVAVGDQVKAGQVLVELDTTDLQIAVNEAQLNIRELTSQASIAAAEQAVANAQQDLKDAQTKVEGLKYPRASDTMIDNTKSELDLAQEALSKATDAYHRVDHLADGDPIKATALFAMTNAQIRVNQLIATLNWYTGKPSDIDVATANANLDAAKANLHEGQWYLAALKGESIPQNATGTQLAILEKAQDALVTAQQALDDARLVTVIPGTVLAVNAIPGQIVSPGEVLIDVVDVTRLHVETTDLSERDVPKVKVGEPVRVTIKALNQDIGGKVTDISPVADTLGGDVVYKTTIALDQQPAGLRAGMSVDVAFGNSSS
jgi:HlyD family secretion protein